MYYFDIKCDHYQQYKNMLVNRINLRGLRLATNILNNNFAKKKKGKGEQQQQRNQGKTQTSTALQQQVQIDQKFQHKSAALYDHYVRSRQRPMLTLDNYRIRYVYVIERLPIFVPYQTKKFEYYRTKYQYMKKTGYYTEIPKQLQVQNGDYLFGEYERVNPQNQITHRNVVSKTQVYQYAQNSRYWRYTDPNIKDSKSIQTYSSDNVYMIVKNKQNGKWTFPYKMLTQKDNHKEIFTLIDMELFGGSQNPLVHFAEKKPIIARKIQDNTLDRGQGYYEYFYKGLTINGVPKFPTENYLDYAWVPKPLLSQYFDDQYFKQTINLAVHLC